MKLGYKTRGKDVSPQGKPRVYFCCHPDDFQRYFDEISNEILKIENCTIFYDEEPLCDDRYVERESILSSMQLFVMPVSSRLLMEGNMGLEDYRIAVKHHVPVLPLMQESGLDRLFNEVCGTLQFLDKYARDDTAISYDVKLKRFINDLLVDSQSAQIIRDSFRAYIFLSYRKKDRTHAQRLMKLIHKNKSCRDIAIWYDEFLVPGENFNTSIDDALNKSELFLLAVTPNLVNEPNYVEQVEYPNAVKSGKEILPVEMSKTDRNLLNEKYINIPNVICEDDERAISKQLSVVFPEKKKGVQDFDRDFCIARAYLDGIDLEVDHAIALEMLTSAANKLHLDSIRMLVRMYRDGKGVERSVERAISWQLKLIAHLEKEFKRDVSVAGTLVQEINTLIGFYGQIRNYKLSLDYALRALEYVNACRAQNIEGLDVYEYSALMCVGSCYISLYNVEMAKKYFGLAFEVASKIYDCEGTVSSALLMCNSASHIAQAYQSEGDYVTALEYYTQIVEIIESYCEGGDDTELLCELFDAYEDMYGICMAMDDYSLARVYCDKLLPISERMHQELDSIEAREMLCTSYRALGAVAEAEGKYELCDEYFKRLLALRMENFEENDPVSARKDLATAYALLATSAKNLQNMQDCEKYMLECVSIREKLAADFPVPEMLSALCRIYDLIGNVYNELDRPDTGLEYHLRELEIAKRLVEQSPENTELLVALAECHMSLGCDYSLYFGDSDKEHFEAGLEIMESLHKKLNNEQSLNNLAFYYQQLADVYSYDNPKKSRAYIDKALKIRENYLKTHDNLNTWREYISCLLAYAYSLYDDDLNRQAEEQYKKAYTAAKGLLARSDDIKTLRAYADCCASVGNFYSFTDRPEEAIIYYAERVTALMQIVNGTQSVTARVSALGGAISLGMEYNELEQYENAREAFLIAEQLYESFGECEYIEEDEIEQRNIFKYLGDVCKNLGDYDEARAYFEKYIEVCKSNGFNHSSGYKLIADVYAEAEDYLSAARYYLACAQAEREYIIKKESDFYDDLCQALILAADCYRLSEEYERAAEVYLSALEEIEKMNELRYDKAKENKEYYEAQKAYNKAHPEALEGDEDEEDYDEYAMDDDEWEPDEEDDFFEDYYEGCRMLSLTQIKLATCYASLGDFEDAELYYRSSASVTLQIMDCCDDISDKDRLAYALSGLGGCGYSECYEQAYKIYCELAEDNPEVYEELAEQVREILEE